ncbi:MAG: tRNA (N(6)-L-threonylcarbamoyladenosine(37)-C(2))-methylthiotransferase MtaB [Acetivibrio sp.]
MVTKMRSVAFLTLGCKVNFYETNGMEKAFHDADYEIKEFSQKADIYVINTCTVTNMADRKSRQMLHKAKKMNPEALIVAVGCYVQAAKEEIEKDESIDLVIGNNQKAKIVEAVEAYFENHEKRTAIQDMKTFQSYEETVIEDAGEKTRAYIKIQDGCNQFCTYCIIPYVRGRIRSRKEEDIIEEVNTLVKKGYQEVVLTGIHLSSYGVDLQGESDFTKLEGKPLLELMKKVNEIEGLERIRLGSLEPRIITEEFVENLKKIDKICPHFHLSLQSGCNEVLVRMNRKYTSEEYLQKCGILRKHFHMPAITTDIIVGFPMETEEEFSITQEFVKKAAFSDVHIFKYSMRKGTKAALLKDQVDEKIKAERSNRLITLGRTMETEYKSSFIGTIQKVLVEEKTRIENQEYWVGHNERYIKIAFPVNIREENFHNCIKEVRLKKESIEGIILSECVL